MSTINLSEFSQTDTLNSQDLLHVNQNGLDRSITSSKLLEQVNGGTPFKLTMKEDSGLTRSLLSSDDQSYITFKNTVQTTVTVLPQSQVNWKEGAVIYLKRDGGNVIVQGEIGVQVNPSASGYTLSEAGQVGALVRVRENVWDFITGGSSITNLTGAPNTLTVETLFLGVATDGSTLDFAKLASEGTIVKTTYHNLTSKAGSAEYIIKTLVQAAADGDVIDGTGAPNYIGGNHALSDGVHCAVLNILGDISVDTFGAIADYNGISGYDNSEAIQSALDFGQNVQQVGASTKTIGNRVGVYLGGGSYLVHETLYIDRFYVNFYGLAFSSIIAWTTISNSSFILEVGTNDRTSGARADECLIENIRFGRHQSNPYQGTYNSSVFGRGAEYNFINSCAAINVNRSHFMSKIKGCTFVGLRLGVRLEGAYLFNIINCFFNFNDRHIQGVHDVVDNVSNNDQVIDGCIFGASIMNGGVWLEGFDGLRISHFDYENSSQLPFYLYQCRSVHFSHLYFENNNKYYRTSATPSYVYQSTPFFTERNDAVPEAYAGFNIVAEACQMVSMDNYLTSNSTVPGRGEVLNTFCQNPVRIENMKITTVIEPDEYYLQQWGTTETGFIVDGLQCAWAQKLLNLSTPAIVKGSRVGGDSAESLPRVWYVDFDNGDDEINLKTMSAANPLRTVNLRAIPEDDARTYVINVTGTSNSIVLSRTHNSGRIKIVGSGQGSASVGSIQIPSSCNFEVSNLEMTVLRLFNDGSHSSQTQGPTKSIIKFENIVSNFNENAGFIQSITDSFIYFDGCTITQSGTAGYSMVVQNGNECWFKDHTITGGKRDEARNFGKIYYQASTYTGTTPIVFSDRMGKVEAL